MNQKHIETIKAFDILPDDAVVPLPVWGQISGRSRASTYRDIACGLLERIKIGGSARLRVGSCRKVLKGAI